MSKILVAAEIPTASKEARDGFISHLQAAAKYSAEKEPGVYKYCICTPSDSADSNTVWAIEEYADKQTLDEHMASPPVKEMMNYMSSNPIVEGTPKIRYLSWVNDMVFTKQEVKDKKDLFIVFADVEFKAGTRDGTLQYWNNNLNSSKAESGCFVYGFAQDPAQPDHLYTLEAYESESFLWDVHVKADAVKDTVEKTKDMRANLTLSKLKMYDGFLAR